MKNYTAICFFLAVAMILCPLVSVSHAKDTFSSNVSGEKPEFTEEIPVPTPTENVKILSVGSGSVTELSLREYLIDSVAAEIGPTAEAEAIKAQAVACHSLLLYTKSHKTESLGNADISDKAQKYLTEEEQKEKWGDKYSAYRSKLEQCVDEVQNKVLCFEDEPIMATFFSVSNGKTENAENVWGKSIPYLVSVESPSDKLSPNFVSSVELTTKEVKAILEKNGAKCEGDPEKWIGKSEQNNTGTVKYLFLGGKEFSGTEIRTMFSLKSATFSLKYDDGKFTFTVKGYGHGVGMSQWGANAMAKSGNTYDEILLHYYKNAVLSTTEQ